MERADELMGPKDQGIWRSNTTFVLPDAYENLETAPPTPGSHVSPTSGSLTMPELGENDIIQESEEFTEFINTNMGLEHGS